MSSPRNPEEPSIEEREGRIAAYVDGEMTPGEAEAFEREMESDEALRGAVAQWRAVLEAGRAWVTAQAPGVERIEALDVGALTGRGRRAAGRARVIRLRGFALRGIAAAAIFVLGFCFGHVTQWPEPTRNGEVETGAGQPRAIDPAGGNRQPRQETDRATADFRLGDSVREANGRLYVTTTLEASGAPAYWVIDGDFEVAQSSHTSWSAKEE